MAPQKAVELFRGNCLSEKAHMWLRTLKGTWRYDTKEEEKLYQFEKGLHPRGQADEWWEELKASEKDKWKNLLTAFERKWGKPRAMQRATEAIIEELKDNTLDLLELGTYDSSPMLLWTPGRSGYRQSKLSPLTPSDTLARTTQPSTPRKNSLWTASAPCTSAPCGSGQHMGAHAKSVRPHCTPVPAVYTPHTPWITRTDEVFGGSTLRPMNTSTKNLANSPISLSAGKGYPTILSSDPGLDCSAREPILTLGWPDMGFPHRDRVSVTDAACSLPPHYGPSACRTFGHPGVPTHELNIRTIVGQILYPPRQCNTSISQINEALDDTD
ncbi:hypothetical protein K438DRAFT_2000165 [Mycena galopus ATCC 62051]|nr:hypothetical protein K438DRAFT_2000165 [Mycena galopus ATCC 62051]